MSIHFNHNFSEHNLASLVFFSFRFLSRTYWGHVNSYEPQGLPMSGTIHFMRTVGHRTENTCCCHLLYSQNSVIKKYVPSGKVESIGLESMDSRIY